jgi:hypothetical protein
VGHALSGAVGQSGSLTVVAVAAGHHEVGLVEVDGSDEFGNGLGRMLQVTVHHHGHPTLGQPEPGHHGTAEATVPLPGLAMEHEDGQGRRLCQSGNDRRRVVTAVVDEYDL